MKQKGKYAGLTPAQIRSWLREANPEKLQTLWHMADETRRAHVGDAVHLRGLVEISNHCVRQCAYCGLRAGNRGLNRYRMTSEEIFAAALKALKFGYETVVLQGGEDLGMSGEGIAALVRRIKRETALAVTLSLGERSEEELALWRAAGADRYLLRFETSDRALFATIHPGACGWVSDRIALLRKLKELGYETGGGIMIGLPGQSYESVANDMALFRELDLDMIGIGPFIAHPQTPLGNAQPKPALREDRQVPNTEVMVYKAVALARLVRPDANIPSTTALATINKYNGRELGLQRGANVVMPNLTPSRYRRFYEIYPAKACIDEAEDEYSRFLPARIGALGRQVGRGAGGRKTELGFERALPSTVGPQDLDYSPCLS